MNLCWIFSCCIGVSVKPWGCSKIFTFTNFSSVLFPRRKCTMYIYLPIFTLPLPHMTWTRVSAESLQYGYRLLQMSLSTGVFHFSVNFSIKFLLAYQELFCGETLIGAWEPTTMMTRVTKYKKKLNRFNKQFTKNPDVHHTFLVDFSDLIAKITLSTLTR